MSAGVLSDSDDSTVCFCHIVTKGQILKAIREGANTIEKIQAETSASTGCSGCEVDVKALLEHELSKK